MDQEWDFVITQNIGTTKGRFRNGMCISSQNGGNFRALLQLNLRGIEVLSHFALRVRQCELGKFRHDLFCILIDLGN